MKINFTPPQYVGCASPLAKILVLLLVGIIIDVTLTTSPVDAFKLLFAIGVSLALLFFISPWYSPAMHRFPFLPVILLAISGIVSVIYEVIHQPLNYQAVILFSIGTCFNLLIISPWYQRIKPKGRTLIVFLFVFYALLTVFLLFQQHLASSILVWLIVLFMTSFLITWCVYILRAK